MATYSKNTTTVEAYQASALITSYETDVTTLPEAILEAALKGCIVFKPEGTDTITVRGNLGTFTANPTDWVLENGDLSVVDNATFTANYTLVP